MPGPSLFSPLAIGATKGKRALHLAWSSAKDQPLLLAVALDGGTVHIIQEDGEPYMDVVLKGKTPGVNASCLSWSPAVQSGGGLLLAIGWADGTTMVWSEKDAAVREDLDTHVPHPVGFVLWSPDGTRLISGDARPGGGAQHEKAVLGVWKVDNRGRFSTICTYRRAATGGLTHAIFRTEGLVKKAVSSMFAAADCPPFYFGGETGAIAHGDAMGHNTDAIKSTGIPIAAMLYYAERDLLVVVSKQHLLSQYSLVDNKPVQIYQAKLSVGKEGLYDAIWAGAGQLAIVSADQVVRVSDLPADDNYVLSLADVPPAAAAEVEDELVSDKLVSLAYHAEAGLLAGGTREGHAVIWRRVSGAPADAPERGWQPMPPVRVSGAPERLAWSSREKLLGVGCSQGLSLMPETVLRRAMCGSWLLLQLSPHRLLLESRAGTALSWETALRVRGCAMHEGHVVLYSNSVVEVWEFDHDSPAPNTPRLAQSFERSALLSVGVWAGSLYIAKPERIEVANLGGVVTSTLPFMDVEGQPTVLAINGRGEEAGAAAGVYLAAGTDRGFVKAWDLSRREPRQHAAGKQLVDAPSRLLSVQVAADGSRISATLELQQGPAAPAKGQPSSVSKGSGGAAPTQWADPATLYVYLVDADAVQSFDFGATGRLPGNHYWDPKESTLLGVETRPSRAAAAAAPAAASHAAEAEAGLEVTTMFSTTEVGLKMQNSVAVDASCESLVGVQVPRFFFASRAAGGGGAAAGGDHGEVGGGNGAEHGSRLRDKVMLDFVGMEEVDAATQKGMLDFSYYLTIGNMDEAHRAVKLIKKTSLWENMARMCVKTKRLDVAEICLGHMGHARGARAVRDTVAQYTGADGVLSQPDVCAAMVAVQLGLIDEAEKLYAGCGRYDLLNELYQCSGQWDKAVQVAEEKDRIHLKATHYLHAKHLEAMGQHTDAIVSYEASGTHRVEVPRMLFDGAQTAQLQAYIDDLQDKELYKWWAQFAESSGQLELALEYYARAGDVLAQVRVLCFRAEHARAAALVTESGDLAGAYHLAKQYEAQEDIREAVRFFQLAQRYSHASRLARAHDLTGELSSLAQQAPPKMMVESAAYFEERGMVAQAVELYQKAGNTGRAIDLCFRHRLFDALRDIADSLSASAERADPALLQRCADFFLDHGQYDKAVRLFTQAGECAKALDLCVLHNISLTEELAENCVPPLGAPGAEDEVARAALLAKVAKCCKRQGNYHLASKKYVQAGDKLKAMKCLLKSGDTEKIAFFAGVSRTKEIYILAANYLQTLDWHSDAEIMRNIVSFYTKAKAQEQLVSFYDACAQVEIDEYRDYEKALGALREAEVHLNKGGRVQDKESKLAQLQTRITQVEAFVSARRMVKTEPETMVSMCHELLEQPDVEAAIRVGDVYALMIEWFYSQRQMEQAHTLVEKMRGRGIILSPYLDAEMVQAIYGAMGEAVPHDPAAPPTAADGGGDEVLDEQIDEADDDDE